MGLLLSVLVNSMFCGKGCILSRFTVTMCISMAVAGGSFCPGDLAIFGIVCFTIVFSFLARTIVIFSTIVTVSGFWEKFSLTEESFFFPFFNSRWFRSRTSVNAVVTFSSRGREGIRLVSSTMTVTCRFVLSA